MSKTTQSRWHGIAVAVVVILFVALVGFFAYRRYQLFTELGWGGFWNLVRKFAWHFFLMLSLLASSVAVVALFVGIQTLFSRWRRIRVFISYQHGNKALVDELTNTLDSSLLEVKFVPFEPADHDRLIATVGNGIRNADFIVVLPGHEQSFVDGEILAAYVLRRPIVFLHHDANQTTPNTALRGYPVFKLSELRRNGFRSLARFITHIANSWRDKMRNFSRVSAGFGARFARVAFIYICGVGIIIDSIGDILIVIDIQLASRFGLFVWWAIAAVASLILHYSYVTIVVERFRAMRVARQTIPTGDLSFEILSRGLDHTEEDRLILSSLEKEPLKLRH